MEQSPESPFAAVRSVRAHERIVEQLQQLILSGKLPAGAHLPSEREMMAEFQVSRPTVREALRVAESMGLIAVRPGDPAGPKVLGAPSLGISRLFDSLMKAGRASASELIEMRILIESAAAVQLCTQPKKRLTTLEGLLEQMKTTEDLSQFAELDARFHRAILENGGNRLFLVIFLGLLAPIQALIAKELHADQHQKRTQALRGHEEIFSALKQGDADAAREATRKHLHDFYKRLLNK